MKLFCINKHTLTTMRIHILFLFFFSPFLCLSHTHFLFLYYHKIRYCTLQFTNFLPLYCTVSYVFVFTFFFSIHTVHRRRNRFPQLRNIDTRSGFFQTSEMKKRNKTTRSRYSTHSFSSELLLTPSTDDTS